MKKWFNLFLSLMLALVMVLPAVNANVVINEIMYQFSGSDTGREWIEVYNSGPATENINNWRLYEGGTNHGISLVSGTTSLDEGDYAVIADNSATFLAEHPGFAGNLFDSTFSLNDAGEELILRDSALADIDTVAYSSTWGDLEDYSLELLNSGLDNNIGSSWSLSTVIFGTPGAENSVYQDALEITDVEHDPEHPILEDVEICARVDHLYPLQDISLHWSSDIGSATIRLYDSDGDGSYCRTLSAVTINPYDGLRIDYYVTVLDVNGNFLSTEGDPEYPEQFFVYDGNNPVADFVCSPTRGVEPLTVRCTSTSDDSVAGRDGLDHDWLFYGGNPATSSALSVDVNYITQGVYGITLIVTDPAGHSDTETRMTEIYVDDSTPNAGFSWTPIIPVDHQLITFDGSDSEDLSYDNIAEYCWDFDDGSEIVCDGDAACTGAGGSCVTATHSYVVGDDYDVTLTVTDVDGPEEGTVTRTVHVAYDDDAPVVGDIPDQIINEGEIFDIFDLDDYLTELDGEEVIWTYGGNVDLTVIIDENNVVTITAPDENWFGAETITFVATDVSAGEESDSDTATFTVNPVNDAPVVGDIPDQTINEGESFTPFDLDDYLTEVDGDDTIWSYSGNSPLIVTIDAENVVMVTTPSLNWDGVRTITFTATDDNAEALSDSDSAIFTVIGINQPPTLDIPDDTVEEDSGLAIYDLTDYAADDEDTDSELTFSLISETNPGVINCELDGQELDCTTIENQNGESTVTITVTDTEGSEATDSFTITVTAANDAPVAEDVEDQTEEEREVIVTLAYTDPDEGDLAESAAVFNVVGGTITTPASCTGGVCTVGLTPIVDSTDDITAEFTVNDGELDSNTATITITIGEVNDPPVAENVIDETEEDEEVIVTLTYTDPDTGDLAESATVFNVVGGTITTPASCTGGICTVGLTPAAGSTEDITAEFTVNDGELNSNTATITITITEVNDAPIVGNIPGQTIDEGETFTSFDLDDYLTELDGDTVIWTYSGETDLIIEIDENNVVTITMPDENWFGAETITFTATDDNEEALSDSDAATFTVNNVNDQPVLELPEEIPEITEGEEYTLTFTADDPDEDELTVTRDIDAGILEHLDNLEFTDNEDGTYTLTFIPDYGLVEHPDWEREFEITIRLSDGTTELVEIIEVTANDVNRAPEVEEIGTIEFKELTQGTYQVVASDPDGDNLNYVLANHPSDMEIKGYGLIAWTPEIGQEDVENIIVRVTDNPYHREMTGGESLVRSGISVDVSFDAIIERILEISNVRVQNRPIEENDDSPAVRPNDQLQVRFELTNNHDGQTIIGILSQLRSRTANIQEDFTGPDRLASGETQEYTLTKRIPLSLAENDYQTRIVANGFINYDRERTAVRDQFEFNLVVEQNPADIIITRLGLNNEDNTVSCSSRTPLTVRYVNRGTTEEEVVIKVVGPNGVILSTSDDDSFDSTIGIGETKSYRFLIPTSELALGENELTVRLIYDNRGNRKTIEETITITRNSCLASYTPAGSSLILAEGEEQEFTVTLREGGYNDQIRWFVDGERISQRGIRYSFSRDDAGEYTVTIKLQGTDEEHSWNVDVREPMEITNLQVENNDVEENGRTTGVRPSQEVEVEVSITNYLDHPITDVTTRLDSELFELTGDSTINLGRGETETITLTGTIPYTAIENDYEATVIATGEDYEDASLIYTDSFDFRFNIEQNPADVIISNLELADEELACKDSTQLALELTNVGERNENDIFIVISGPNGLELTEGPLTINQNARRTFTYTIPSERLSPGSNTLEVEVSYRNNFETVTDSIDITKNDCLDDYTPTEHDLTIPDCTDQDFTVELNEPGYANIVSWYVDNVEVGTGLAYTFNECEPGVYEIEAVVDTNGQETSEWTVTVTDVPLSDYMQISTCPFVLENQYAKVEYHEEPELDELLDIDNVARLTEGQVAIDGITAEELDGAATITIKRDYQNHVILASRGFGQGPFVECPSNVCRALSNINGEFIFSVTGFSTYRTYRVEERSSAAIDITGIEFENAMAGETVNLTVTVTNTGTYNALTNLRASLENVAGKYHAQIIGSLPGTLNAGQSATVQLRLTVPEGESSSRHSIGAFKVTSAEDSATETIYLSTQSWLNIADVEINGDNNGGLKVDENNEITVTVKNDYSQDMEDVEVTVTILDVDNDDLEETAEEEQDIDVGKDEDFTVNFDLSGEEIDNDQYTIEITAEGKAKDGTKHQVTETLEVGLDLEKHKVKIKKADLAFEMLQCSRQNSLRVSIENVGDSDEDEIEVRISNQALGLQLSKDNIKLDKFTESDDTETITFPLSLDSAEAGTYTLNVELYLDGDLEDSTTLSFEIKDCLSSDSKSTTQPTQTSNDLMRQLQEQLYGQLATPQGQILVTPGTTMKATFRNSTTYLALLAVMILLCFIGLVLAMTALMIRKKRRKS